MSTSPTAPQIDPQRLEILRLVKAVVVKVGTRVLTAPGGRLDSGRIEILSEQLCRIADSGRQTIMVSSGAVGAGVGKLGLAARPAGLAQLQAIAAIGQTDLIQAYETALAKRGRHAAQVLLTASDLRRRSGYLHVRNALSQIHAFGAIAVINENDSVAVAELMTTFGDNDRLAANVAGLLSNALVVILSAVDGLYDGPPSLPTSQRIPLVRELNDSVFALAQDHKSNTSKGGMASKLRAAEAAISFGHPTVIAAGRDDTVLDRIMAGHDVGTLFLPPPKAIRGRRRWIGSAAHVEGNLTLDDGAVRAVAQKDSSLLAIGVKQVSGEFGRGAVVSLRTQDGREIARGLTNYPSDEIQLILGLPSEKIAPVLGHRPYEVVVHRDNLVLTS
ncbi:MAG: glutamate 5-kinase [Planctomycetaceae bacterium]